MEKKKIVSFAAAIALTAGVSLYGGSEGDGQYNVYYGSDAGSSLDGTGYGNVFMGYEAGILTDGGDENTFSGHRSGYSNTRGS